MLHKNSLGSWIQVGDVIKKKLKTYITVIISCILLLVGYATFSILKWQSINGVDERKIRMEFNSLVYKVEAADYTNPNELASVTRLPYTLVGLDGKVIYSQGMDYNSGQQLNLHTLAIINTSSYEYRIPVSQNEKQFGTLLIKFDQKEYSKPGSYSILLFSPLIFGLIVILAFIYLLIKLLKQDVLYPISKLHTTTKNIMDGNFSSPLMYDYDGEIGTLCHDFELMRSELQDSYLREQELKKKETLLLASISHDLKTPLAGITGYVEGILYDVVEEKEDIKKYASIILNKATSLDKLVDDILEHSKANLNQFSIQKKEVYAKAFFENLLFELLQDAQQKGFEFTYDSVPNVLLSLDSRRIAQVMRNLVDNSIKYGNPCGKIHVSFCLQETMLIISVEDNGKGISAADLPFIFDEFYRGDKARSQGIGGSGLGLNISKYIVEKHGGKIECDSILGVGTTITFSLLVH